MSINSRMVGVAYSYDEVLQRSKTESTKAARILTNTMLSAQVKTMQEETHCLDINPCGNAIRKSKETFSIKLDLESKGCGIATVKESERYW